MNLSGNDNPMNLAVIQSALRERNIDAWLFYDHHHRDAIAYRTLGLPDGLMVTRRWYYLIPAEGTPQKLVHRLKPGISILSPATSTHTPRGRSCLRASRTFSVHTRRLPCSTRRTTPSSMSRLLDAGTVELVRSLGKEIVTSADLVPASKPRST